MKRAKTDPLAESLNSLPTDIVADILGRVPVKYLVRLKCTSKSLRYFLGDPLNVNLYLKSHREPILVAQSKTYMGRILNLYQVDPKGNSSIIYTSACSKKIKSKFCNGLFCSFDGSDKKFHILNLATKQVVQIPRVHPYYTGYWCEFGFNSSREEYKVLVWVNGSMNLCNFQVCTLGPNSWRATKNQPAAPLNQDQVTSFCVSGKFYWYTSGSTIISFDMCSEEFGNVQAPKRQFPEILTMKNAEGALFELEGKLCLVDVLCHNEFYPTRLDLWMLSDEWVMMKSITLPYMTRCLETPFSNRCGELVIATRSMGESRDIYLYSLLTQQVHTVPAVVRHCSSEGFYAMKYLESYF